MNFGEQLKWYRKLRGYTQQELADEMGVSRSAICNYEKGIRKPDIEDLELFSSILNVDFNEIMGYKKEPAHSRMLNADLVRDLMKLNDSQIEAVRNLVKAFLQDN